MIGRSLPPVLCAASVDVAIVFDASMKSAADTLHGQLRTQSSIHTHSTAAVLDSRSSPLQIRPRQAAALTHSSVALSTAIDSRDASAGTTCSMRPQACAEHLGDERAQAKAGHISERWQGHAAGRRPAAIAEAADARASGTRILAVGLSDSVSSSTIESIASEPATDFARVYSASSAVASAWMASVREEAARLPPVGLALRPNEYDGDHSWPRVGTRAQ